MSRLKESHGKRPSGPRLRLTILIATAAAFLLVPAAAASAAINTHITIAGSGSGKVVGIEPSPGAPPINCEYISPGPPTGTCDAEAQKPEPEAPFFAISVKHEAAPGSKFVEWKVEKGGAVGCVQGSPAAGSCSVTLSGEIKIKAVFEKEPNVHIKIAGSGSGTVKSKAGELGGTPSINCHWNGETATKTGTCDNVNGSAFGGALEGIGVKQEADAGSEFVEWIVEEGTESGGDCFPGEVECTVFTFGEEIKIKAVFAVVPKFKLTVTKSGGTGTGTVTSSPAGINCGVDCNEEYTGGTKVTLTKTEDPGSKFIEWTGACSGSGACEVTMSEAKSVNAKFDLESRKVNVFQEGEGSVECKDATAGGSFAACTEYPYGHTIQVKATPAAEQELESISGGGSATGKCHFETKSCEFVITVESSVTVKFIPASTSDIKTANVEGKVPQKTELGSTCDTVYLGEFKPLEPAKNYPKTCVLTVTSTGAVTALTAADASGEPEIGHLVNHATGGPYSLAKPLETKATDTEGLGGTSGTGGLLAPLTSLVTLLNYATPVNADNVTLEFNQLIGSHDPLRTGIYSKTITLTLKQTTP